MKSLPSLTGCPALRADPLPVALYESNGLLFELYDGGQPSQPMVIRWEQLQPVIRKDNMNTWSAKVLQAEPMKMIDFLNALRDCFHQGLSAKTGWGREDLDAVFELAISNALAQKTTIE